jgi:hypothetical protein
VTEADHLNRWPVVVGRHWMPAVSAERSLRADLRAAVITYLTEVAEEPAEVAVRAAELCVADQIGDRLGVMRIMLTADQLTHYATRATEETS